MTILKGIHFKRNNLEHFSSEERILTNDKSDKEQTESYNSEKYKGGKDNS